MPVPHFLTENASQNNHLRVHKVSNHANLDKKKFHGELEQLYLKMPEIKGRIQKDRQQIVVESVNLTSKNIQKSNMLRDPWLTIALIRGTHVQQLNFYIDPTPSLFFFISKENCMIIH